MEEQKLLFKDSIIDQNLTLDILNKYNRGDYDHIKPLSIKGFPPVDNKTVINKTSKVSYSINQKKLTEKLNKFNIQGLTNLSEGIENNTRILSEDDLHKLGIKLMPFYSFGILNGGSATSYADSKKNSSFNEELFGLLQEPFNTLADLSTGEAKGITPAFLNPDGSSGPSFIELKMRALLLNDCPSMFQMTSYYNNESIKKTYKKYSDSLFLKDLIKEKNINICDVKTGIQPLLAAFTHSSKGKKKDIFINTNGEMLPIPGGHGQCFITLKNIFSELYRKGIRFISIGNVDNIGYTPDPVSLAILALSGKQAGFDFSYKTSLVITLFK